MLEEGQHFIKLWQKLGSITFWGTTLTHKHWDQTEMVLQE